MRKSWDDYFFDITLAVASRSTCPRRSVGAVLIDTHTRQILSTGYNGSPRGAPQCDEQGCYMKDGHCIRTVHAETNALLMASPAVRKNATMYVTDTPCWHCALSIANSGIGTVHALRPYRNNPDIYTLFDEVGITLYERD